ncbi:MAG: VIT and VWA domain-containing protein [Planctomycetota bacterium]|nr:VIT and VWA domain-containing protein [Planctomycetota bacterium]
MIHLQRSAFLGLLTLFTAFSSSTILSAQGLVVGPGIQQVTPNPRGGLVLKSLEIQARIVDGVATTTLAQVFHNPGKRIAEATWIMPLPPGATADDFTMTMNGKQVRGEVLDQHRARRVYENIVRQQRDPGLLEYMGNGCLRARVFPILAKADMRVEVRFRQVLPETGGIHQWSFPLRAANVHGKPAQRISLDLRIQSQKPIKNVYSPTDGVDVMRKGEHEARVSFEMHGSQMAKRDLQVFYGLSDQEFGLNLLTHRAGDHAGYFMMMLAPKLSWDDSKLLPKLVNFVVDTSGSMNGKKIQQARAALKFFLNSLQTHDYFNVIPFSTDARPFFPQPVQASADNIAKALKQSAEIQARGGTNIEKGLTTALAADTPAEDVELLKMTVFLTDGLPTVDTTDAASLLSIIKGSNKAKQRIFVFGVGHDVNTRLLDKIADQSHGARDYVRENESIEMKTGALFTKLSHPVMSSVRIDCKGIEGFDVFPKDTPDLFKGSRLILTGRYKGKGNHAIRLTGVVNGKEKTYVYESSFPAKNPKNDFLSTLWAQRKVAVLLDNLRLNGHNQELVHEIRRIGAAHGIITPYTSHLILEEGQKLSRHRFGFAGGERALFVAPGAPATVGSTTRDRLQKELRRSGAVTTDGAGISFKGLGSQVAESKKAAEKSLSEFGAVTGQAAVDKSAALQTLTKAKALRGNRGAVGLVTRSIKGRTFHLIQGIWIDSKFTAAMKDKVQEIKAFSKEYFALLQKHPELAKVFAFSTRMLVVIDGKRAIELR